MKVFLSSTTYDLLDARQYYLEKINNECPEVELIYYEKHGCTVTGENEQEKCLNLVSQCKKIILLLDKYYGTKYAKNPSISITHAEVLEARKNNLKIIPIVRKQSWHEHKVWKKNKYVSTTGRTGWIHPLATADG